MPEVRKGFVVTPRKHRYDYDTARELRLAAESAGDWPQATYWLAQQISVEHREEMHGQHKAHLIMDILLVTIAVCQFVEAAWLVLR